MTEFETITALMKREGWDAYTNHPADRGGPTKWGITLMSWAGYVKRAPALSPGGAQYPGPPVTAAEIEALTEKDARLFYRRVFIIDPNFHKIEDTALRELVIDAGVNHGPRHPSKWLQWAAEVKQDGVIGPVSLAAINACAPGELFLWVCSFRIRLYGKLVSQDPEVKKAKAAGIRLQAEFAAGWNNRIAEFMEAAARVIEAQHNQTKELHHA